MFIITFISNYSSLLSIEFIPSKTVLHCRDFRDLGLSSPPPKPDRIAETILEQANNNQNNINSNNSPVSKVLAESISKYKSASVNYISSIFSSPSSSVADTLSPTPSLRKGGVSPMKSVGGYSPKPGTNGSPMNCTSDDENGNRGIESGLSSTNIKNIQIISADDIPADFIPSNTFMSRMGMLKQQKAWVEKVDIYIKHVH